MFLWLVLVSKDKSDFCVKYLQNILLKWDSIDDKLIDEAYYG